MHRSIPWSFALAAVLAAGCSAGGTSLSISTRAGAPLKAGASAPAAPAASAVTVEKVHFVIRKLELKGVDASGKEIEAKAGPIAVDITDFTSGTTHSVSAASIPPGNYTRLEMEIGDIEVTGMDAGAPYDFKTDVDVEQEICGTFNVATDGTLNFTVNVDPSTWFTDPSDPTKQLSPSDPANRGAIEENIERSFEVFEDANEDGSDDDCECGSSDGSGSGGSGGMSASSPTSSHEGGTGCSCSSACTPPPPACQPLGASCTTSADCCGGTATPTAPATATCAPAPAPATGMTCQSLL